MDSYTIDIWWKFKKRVTQRQTHFIHDVNNKRLIVTRRSLDMTWPLGTVSFFGYLSKADLNNEVMNNRC